MLENNVEQNQRTNQREQKKKPFQLRAKEPIEFLIINFHL